jgi:soluble lytic murein transglycosylase-like protein
MSNITTFRPAVQVDVGWLSDAFTWPADIKEFRDVRKQFRQLKDLQRKLQSDLTNLREAEKAAHAKLASQPSAETVAAAEQARRAVTLAAEETPRSLKHIDNSLDELVRNRLAPVAIKLNNAIAEFLIIESKSIEKQEQDLAKKYQADQYIPSELVKALIYRASRFYTTAQSIEKIGAGGARNLTPDSCLDGVIPSEK